MGLIMKLTVKKEYLESEIHASHNNSSIKVVLKEATQEQLAILKSKGDFDHLFENAKEK